MKINPKPQISQERRAPTAQEMPRSVEVAMKVAVSVSFLALSAFYYNMYSSFSDRCRNESFFGFIGAMCGIAKGSTGLAALSLLACSVIVWLPRISENPKSESNIKTIDQRQQGSPSAARLSIPIPR